MQYLVQLRAAMHQANRIDAGEGAGADISSGADPSQDRPPLLAAWRKQPG
jgi:hypothetical protein